jgi:excisionase family DNA binding protein
MNIELVPVTRTDVAPPKLLLTPREAAKTLSLSTRTLYNLRQTGELRAVQVGRSVRFSVDDLKSWIAGATEKKCDTAKNVLDEMASAR